MKQKRCDIWVPGWKRIRELIHKRDNYQCVVCGKTQKEEQEAVGRTLTVNHINGDLNDNSDLNLETLCCSCHGRKDGIRTHISPVEKDKKEIIRLYMENGLSQLDIAKIFGVSGHTISTRFVKWGIKTRNQKETMLLACQKKRLWKNTS